MTQYRIFTDTPARKQPTRDCSSPFPPAYYDNQRRAKRMLEQMTTPPQKKAAKTAPH